MTNGFNAQKALEVAVAGVLYDKEDFLYTLKTTPPLTIVGHGRDPWCCPIARWLKTTLHYNLGLDIQVKVYRDRVEAMYPTIGKIVLETPTWVSHFVDTVDEEFFAGEPITAAVALKLLEEIPDFGQEG